MLLKYLLVGIIFYYIVKASGNLMRAMRGELNAPSRDPRFGQQGRNRGPTAASGWEANGRGDGADRNGRWEGDIEDAKWEDL